MSGTGNRVPDYRREINELKEEIKKLWLTLGRQPALPPVQKQMPFSWSGTVSGVKNSGPWLAENNLFITGCTMSQATAPSSSCAAVLLINGVNVYTFWLYAGQSRGGTAMRQAVSTGDRIQLQVWGGGGTDLVASLTYISNDGW